MGLVIVQAYQPLNDQDWDGQLCVHVCMYGCMCVCVCVYNACVCMWRPGVNFSCHPQELHTLFFETRVSHWDLGLADKGKLTGQGPQGSFCLHFRSAGITNTCRYAQLFTWVLEIELKSSYLYSKDFPD